MPRTKRERRKGEGVKETIFDGGEKKMVWYMTNTTYTTGFKSCER